MATIRSTPPRRPSQPRSVTRTSYQVGRPWMLEGKMLRGETGIPMRRKLLANSSFAEAEPEPLTLANLMTKSLTASSRFISVFIGVIELAQDRIELELAEVGLVGEEFLAHLIRLFTNSW